MDGERNEWPEAVAAPELPADPQPAPPLPPPPASHTFSGFYIDHMQFEARLRQLREKARRRANSALTCLRLAGGLLIVWSVLLAVALFFHLYDWRLDGLSVLWALPASALGISVGLIVLLRGARLFDHQYRRAWQGMLHGNEAQRFADDERLRIVQARLPLALWWVPAARRPFGELADRIEFCAFHLPGLRALTTNPESPGWWTLRLAENARQFARQLDHGALVFAGCLLGLFMPWLCILLIAQGLLYSPRVITAYAALVAFIDSYLEEPRLAVDSLPPLEAQGFLAELADAWGTGSAV